MSQPGAGEKPSIFNIPDIEDDDRLDPHSSPDVPQVSPFADMHSRRDSDIRFDDTKKLKPIDLTQEPPETEEDSKPRFVDTAPRAKTLDEMIKELSEEIDLQAETPQELADTEKIITILESDSDIPATEKSRVKLVREYIKSKISLLTQNPRLRTVLRSLGDFGPARFDRLQREHNPSNRQTEQQTPDRELPPEERTINARRDEEQISMSLIREMDDLHAREENSEEREQRIATHSIELATLEQNRTDNQAILDSDIVPEIEAQFEYLQQFLSSTGPEFAQLVQADTRDFVALQEQLDQMDEVLKNLETKAHGQMESRFRGLTKAFDEIKLPGVQRLAGAKLYYQVNTLRSRLAQVRQLASENRSIATTIESKKKTIDGLQVQIVEDKKWIKEHKKEINNLRKKLGLPEMYIDEPVVSVEPNPPVENQEHEIEVPIFRGQEAPFWPVTPNREPTDDEVNLLQKLVQDSGLRVENGQIQIPETGARIFWKIRDGEPGADRSGYLTDVTYMGYEPGNSAIIVRLDDERSTTPRYETISAVNLDKLTIRVQAEKWVDEEP